MADEVVPPANGATRRYQTGVVALAIVLLCQGVVAVVSCFHPPQQWDIVKDVLTHFAQVDTAILTGLFALSRPAA